MIENNAFLIDTNILVYNYDKSDAEKHEIAKDMIDRCWQGKEKFVLSSQNLSEFFSVTTRKGIRSKKDAIIDIADMIKFPGFVKIDFDHKIIPEAAKLSEQHNMHYWDALLAATMRRNGIFNLYTENAKDFRIPWLNVVNPFKSMGEE